jgi:hypothetical protein
MNNNFINSTPLMTATPLAQGGNLNVQNSSQQLIKFMTNSIIVFAQALGFDLQAAEKQFKVVFTSTTLVKPNPRAFEVLVYFMLSQLDAERAQRTFAQCWPPVTKDQQKEFKEAIYLWLMEISNINSTTNKQQQFSKQQQSLLANVRVPNIAKSLLVSPGGFKTCELLFSLIMYVTLVKLLRLSKCNSYD